MESLLPHATGLAAALGGGLLIGLERERRKGSGAGRAAAGIRSFALAALAGGMAQALGQPLLVAVGGLLVVALVAVAYWQSLRPPPDATSTSAATPIDPGLTTELALFVTYLVGVLSVQQPALGASAAVVVAMLLAARERLHRFATRALSEAELHDALILAALVLVALPLAPATPLSWLASLSARTLLLLMVLILALQAAGHVALRLLGPRAGLALSGLLSGFVSSTATIAAMGTRARAEPALLAACTAGAVASTAATWLQALAMLTALAPAAATALLPVAGAGALTALMAAALALRAKKAKATATTTATPTATAPARATAGDASAAAAVSSAVDRPVESAEDRPVNTAPSPPVADGASPAGARRQAGPLRLREALLVTGVLAAVTVAVHFAQQQFGDAGRLAGTALAALADAHAPVVALGALAAAGDIDTRAVVVGVLVAVGANSLTRSVTAVVAGGPRYGLRVVLALMASMAAAAAVSWLIWGQG